MIGHAIYNSQPLVRSQFFLSLLTQKLRWRQPHPLTGVVVLQVAGRPISGASRHAHGCWSYSRAEPPQADAPTTLLA